MQHPSHDCHAPTCKKQNVHSYAPSGRVLKLLARAAAHTGRKAAGVVYGGEYNGKTRARFEPEKLKRCGCGRVQRICTAGKMSGTRCACGQLKPCGETTKKRKS